MAANKTQTARHKTRRAAKGKMINRLAIIGSRNFTPSFAAAKIDDRIGKHYPALAVIITTDYVGACEGAIAAAHHRKIPLVVITRENDNAPALAASFQAAAKGSDKVLMLFDGKTPTTKKMIGSIPAARADVVKATADCEMISGAAAARKIGVSQAAINKAASAGRISPARAGLYDADVIAVEFANNRQRDARNTGSATAAEREAADANAQAAMDAAGVSATDLENVKNAPLLYQRMLAVLDKISITPEQQRHLGRVASLLRVLTSQGEVVQNFIMLEERAGRLADVKRAEQMAFNFAREVIVIVGKQPDNYAATIATKCGCDVATARAALDEITAHAIERIRAVKPVAPESIGKAAR